MQTPTLDFVVIFVSDLDASLAFFVNTLGFERVTAGDGPGFRQLRGKGGIQFGLQLPPSASYEGGGKAGDIELYIKTDDIAAMHTRIIANGVPAGPVLERPFGPIVPLPDTPDGLSVIVLGSRQAVNAA